MQAKDILAQHDVLLAVFRERMAQDDKWGEQNHAPEVWLAILTEEVGEVAKAILEWRHQKPVLKAGWEYEAELVQVAAVAIAALESYRRNEAHGPADKNDDRDGRLPSAPSGGCALRADSCLHVDHRTHWPSGM